MNFLKCIVKKVNGSVQIAHSAFTVETEQKKCLDALRPVLGTGYVVLGLRPEDVRIHAEKRIEGSVPAEIYVTEPLGNETIVDVKMGENVVKVIEEPDFEGKSGQKIWIKIDSAKIHFFHDETHECIYHASKKDRIDIL